MSTRNRSSAAPTNGRRQTTSARSSHRRRKAEEYWQENPVEVPQEPVDKASPRRGLPGGPRPRRKTVAVGFAITPLSSDLLESLADHYQMSKTAVLEMLVRDRARELGMMPGFASPTRY